MMMKTGGGTEIEIVTDRWGVAHIRAADAVGVFLGQGYWAASTRLFQMELWRRRGLGLIAEVLGAGSVDLDVAARTFLARTSLEQELAVLPDLTRTAFESFVAGVNRRIAEVLDDPALLPVELATIGMTPAPWTVEALLSIRIHGLHSNAEEEIARAITLRDLGPEVERLRRIREPDVEMTVPDGLDLALIDPSILDVYRRAHEPVPFGSSPAPAAPDGSNNWAIAGSRTATGRPIVATDPHRIMTFPALRTIVHLSCPEFDAIGMTEPYMPGIAGGHNGTVAWGFTIAPMDVEDVYVYELDPADPGRYRYGDGWERMTSVTESIPVAGEAPREVELSFTRHGPVLKVDADRGAAFALRAMWLEPGATPYVGSLGLLGVRSAGELAEALEGCAAPGLNYVAADVDGGILWQTAGRAPVRRGWDGLLPVPGDGRYEWDGALVAHDLPGLVDPEQGWVRSANHCNLDEDPDWRGRPYSYEWYPGYRARRIAEALGARDDWTVADAGALQNDALTLAARDALKEIADELAHPFADQDAELARLELTAWDQRMRHESRAAAIFDRWLYGHLPAAIRTDAAERIAGTEGVGAALAVLLDTSRATVGDPRVDLALLARARSTGTARRALLERTLAAAVAELRARAGGTTGFRWGDVQVSHLRHPLHGLDGFPDHLGDTGRHPKSGSSDTVGLAFGAEGVQTLGAATRIVMDVGDWDASVFVTMPGVHGDVEAPHALDLFDDWLNERFVPLVYSREAVAANAESSLVIRAEAPDGEGLR